MTSNPARLIADDDAADGSIPPAAATPVQLPALRPAPRNELVVPVLLAGLAVMWLLAVGCAVMAASVGRVMNVAVAVSWTSAALSPLALLGVAWIAWSGSARRGRRRLAVTGASLSAETALLEATLDRLHARLADQRAEIAGQADLIARVGEETGRRVLTVGETLRDGAGLLARHAALLDDTAEGARRDLGVLIADLPDADARVERLTARLRDAGEAAAERVDALTAGLSRVAAEAERTHALDVLIAGLDGTVGALAARIEGVAAGLDGRVVALCGEVARGTDAIRAAANEQAAALTAMADHGRDTIEAAGVGLLDELTRASSGCLAEISAIGDALGDRGEEARALFAGLTKRLTEFETRQVALTEGGVARARALDQAIGSSAGELERLTNIIGATDLAGGAATTRLAALRDVLDACAERLIEGLPPLVEDAGARLGIVGEQAAGVEARIAALAARLRQTGDAVVEQIALAEQSVVGVATGAEAMATRLAAAAGEAASLTEVIGTADAAAASYVSTTGPALIDAMVRAREAGNQAAERAREALASVVPPAAAHLAQEARTAVDGAIAGVLADRSAEIADTAERALATTEAALSGVDARLEALSEALDRADARIEAGRTAAEQAGDNSFSRRLTLLVEALNSTAIDITKVLSNDVTDTAWAAYLKGDRGVFARRAVRLLDTGEAREILRHYETDREFRAQVDRYVHDFEAMLRDVLAFRSGTPIGVTLLSSDVGKLYVALAQAIERLRA